jgi:hypothetical protein
METLLPGALGRDAGCAGRRATMLPPSGAVAEWLRSGLQSRSHRFDSGRRLSRNLCKAEVSAHVTFSRTSGRTSTAPPPSLPVRSTCSELDA